MPFGRMMRFAGGTPPVMIATCFFCQNFSAVAFGTEGIAAFTGNRFHDYIYAVTVGAMPARGTVYSRSENPVTIGTAPVFGGANGIDLMPCFTCGAIPNIRTGLSDG